MGVSMNLGYFEVENGSITLVIDLPCGGHTYQLIDNPTLISAFKKVSNSAPGQLSNLRMSITDIDKDESTNHA